MIYEVSGSDLIKYLKQLGKGDNEMTNENEKKFFIAGVKFHPGAVDIIRKLSEGDVLDLLPEPDNRYDSNAVRIKSKGILLGYIPKKFSAEASAMIEINHCECVVTQVNPNGKTWEMCEVAVRIANEEELDLQDLPDSDLDEELPCSECGGLVENGVCTNCGYVE